MFVFLKVLLFFFRPIVWIVLLFLIALLTKNEKRRKRLFLISFIALVFFTNPFIIGKLLQLYEAKSVTLSPGTKYETGIVLGGFVSYNKADDKGYFNPASDRFIETALLYKTGHINRVIVAAGNGYIVKHNFREAEFIKQHLVELGVPADSIFTDPTSRNTLENANNSKKIIDSVPVKGPYLLITSALHMPRAHMVFAKRGIQTTAYPCDFISKGVGNNFLEDLFLPSSTALEHWDNFIKELLGIITYKVTGKG